MRTALAPTLLLALLVFQPTPVEARRYEKSPVAGWEEVVFNERTRYRLTPDCVRAEAAGSASGLIREREVNLSRTPRLSWAWKAERFPSVAPPESERARQGDDFVARVYVIHKAFFPWNSKGINYVWSRGEGEGAHWPNPFTANAHMVVVQAGHEDTGEWRRFERDVRADFRRYLGMDVERVDAVAVMTDTDNNGGTAEVCYRLPRFSGEAGASSDTSPGLSDPP